MRAVSRQSWLGPAAWSPGGGPSPILAEVFVVGVPAIPGWGLALSLPGVPLSQSGGGCPKRAAGGDVRGVE